MKGEKMNSKNQYNFEGISTVYSDCHEDWMIEEANKNKKTGCKIPVLVQDLNALGRLKIALEIVESVSNDHNSGKIQMSAKVYSEITKNRVQLNESIANLNFMNF